MANTKKIVRFKCPYCDKSFERAPLVRHVDDVHQDMIPAGYSALRVVFDYVNKYPAGYNGKCTECGGPTGWDENKGRYNRQCGKQACHDSYVRKFEENMKRKRGVDRISKTEEGQEKMLASRKISGKYRFQNGKEKTYTGKNELKALEFEDKVMNLNPDDLMCPGPVLGYEYNGETHMYITDQYYIPYNLLIEVKDGGNNPNKRDMPDYRAKQIAKEEHIIKNTNYNYLRLTDNDLSQLLAVFMDLKLQLVENTGERVIHVNEAMNALLTGFPGFRDTGSLYVVNYAQNNVFTGEMEEGLGFSNTIKLDNLIARDKEGILRKTPKNFLEDKQYTIYEIDQSDIRVDLSKLTLNEFCSETQLEEALFGQKLYTYDQIQLFEFVTPVMDFYASMDMIRESTINYLKGKPKNTIEVSENQFQDLLSGKVYTENSKTGLFLEHTEIADKFLDMISANNTSINEKYIINESDILYNKHKFDSGEINLCFITGLSGSGKTSMAKTIESKSIEMYELDDVIQNKEHFTMDQLKEYGDLIYTFFNGIGKKYYYTYDEAEQGIVKEIEDYYHKLINDFVNHAIKYANSHRQKKYIIEGIQLYELIEPEKLKKFAVYIKGTSALISAIRGSKRNIKNNYGNDDNIKLSLKTKIALTTSQFKLNFLEEKSVRKYRNYFSSLMKKENN